MPTMTIVVTSAQDGATSCTATIDNPPTTLSGPASVIGQDIARIIAQTIS